MVSSSDCWCFDSDPDEKANLIRIKLFYRNLDNKRWQYYDDKDYIRVIFS